jgi:WD40 repeat protein
LINSLLKTEKPIPFDFLINGQFLRTSVDEFLTANGISAEQTLDVEYVRAIVPPSQATLLPHDDWVSSVDLLSRNTSASRWAEKDAVLIGHERILSGSYDNIVRVWNMSSEVIASSPSASEGGHTNDVKAVKFLSPTRLVSASLDRTIRVWKYADDPFNPSKADISPALELYGHRDSVDDVAVHGPTHRILSASADHTIGLWSTSKNNATSAPPSLLPSASPSFSNKRRKIGSEGPQSQAAPQRGPLIQLSGHSDGATGVIFAPQDPDLAHSVSFDHTLQTWDLPTQRSLDSRTLPASLYSLCALPGLNLLAAGSMARTISLVDTRVSSSTVVAMTLRGHAGAVSSVAAAPVEAIGGPWGLVSAGFDGTCRVWDVRSVRTGIASGVTGAGAEGESVYVIEREGEKGRRLQAAERTKVMGVAWDQDVGIVAGGSDHQVQINRSSP